MSTLNQTNQPVNSGVTTANYTVPAGKYAKVKAYFYSPRTIATGSLITPSAITLNGSSILTESVFLFSLSTSQGVGVSGFNYIAEGNAFSGGIGTLTMLNGSYTFSNGYCAAPQSAGSNITTGTSATFSGKITIPNVPSQIELWCKPGDVIAASAGNFRIIYEEYTATF